MRLKIRFRKKSVTYSFTITQEDLEAVSFRHEEIVKMQQLDKTKQPLKVLESLLIKSRAINRQRKIIYKEAKPFRKWRRQDG